MPNHYIHDGTAYKHVVGAAIHDGTAWKNVLKKWRHDGTGWKLYFDTAVDPGVPVVQISPGGPLYGTCEALVVLVDPQVPCSPHVSASAVVTGGTGPFTFAWTRIADPDPEFPGGPGNFLDPSQLTLQDVTFSVPSGLSSIERTQAWRVTVTDTSDMSVTVDTVQVTLERHNNA